MSKVDTQKIIAPIMKFVNMRGIIALKDGMLAILPLTVVGSLFLIVGQLPFEGLNQAIAGVFGADWTEPFMQVYSGTFAIMGLISCFSIGYSYAKNSGVEPLPAGVLSLSSFFILLKSSYIPEKGEAIADAIAKVWFGGQGIIAGINAALFSRSRKFKDETYRPFVLKRDEAYIGVMIDDLITQGVDEPYRMFTASAEYRLKLRHDTADERLTLKAFKLGLQKRKAVLKLNKKLKLKQEIIDRWKLIKITENLYAKHPELKAHAGKSLAEALHDPQVPISTINAIDLISATAPAEIRDAAELEIRYEHYISVQDKRIEKVKRMEHIPIPQNFNYDEVSGLSTESRARLKKVSPETIGQAGRIPGIRPADIMLLTVKLK